MKIRFDHPATVFLSCEPGDEIHIANPSQAVTSLLASTRADGTRVARLVSDNDDHEADEVADLDRSDLEMAVLASGPSLTQGDVDYCRGKAPVIAVNDTYRLASWADVLYACDAKWWDARMGAPEFPGLKFALRNGAGKWPGVQVLRDGGDSGLSSDPSELSNGKNSGYQAINLAVHLGAKRIVLLGYDMQSAKDGRTHFFGEHKGALNKGAAPFEWWIANFASMVQPAKALGVSIINCTGRTALACFPRMALVDAL